MPEVVAAIAIGALIFGLHQLIRRRIDRRAAAEQKAQEAISLAVRNVSYLELDAALALHWDHLSVGTRERVRALRNDLYLKAEK